MEKSSVICSDLLASNNKICGCPDEGASATQSGRKGHWNENLQRQFSGKDINLHSCTVTPPGQIHSGSLECSHCVCELSPSSLALLIAWTKLSGSVS